MALAVGMLLDNSVVVLENIYRLSGARYSAKQFAAKVMIFRLKKNG
jgi:multidrug efflux pump subunit AcrB